MAFSLDTFDETVMQLLQAAITGHGSPMLVHDTFAPEKKDSKVIVADLPYLVFLSGDSILEGARTVAHQGAKERGFHIMFVGGDRAQAKAAGDLAKYFLHERRLDVVEFPGASRIEFGERTAIARDQVYTGLGGQPLIYGRDSYTFVP